MLNAPVLILSDESVKYRLKVVGAISLILSDFYTLESEINKLRVENKLFGEIKWEKVKNDGKYINTYLHMLNVAFNLKSLRFHSNSFSGNQFKAGYALVRSISWKLKKIKYMDEVGILFDKCQDKETKTTREILEYAPDFYNKLMFCTDTDSKIFNTMQLTDILTGCMAYKLNVINGNITNVNKHKISFIEKVELKVDGLDMETSFSSLWDYDAKKIQHFDLG